MDRRKQPSRASARCARRRHAAAEVVVPRHTRRDRETAIYRPPAGVPGRRAKANLLAILRELVLFRDGERMASLAPSPG
jgi:hypothetical protein